MHAHPCWELKDPLDKRVEQGTERGSCCPRSLSESVSFSRTMCSILLGLSQATGGVLGPGQLPAHPHPPVRLVND